MAINDRKIEKLKERSAQLEKRIKEDTAEDRIGDQCHNVFILNHNINVSAATQ